MKKNFLVVLCALICAFGKANLIVNLNLGIPTQYISVNQTNQNVLLFSVTNDTATSGGDNARLTSLQFQINGPNPTSYFANVTLFDQNNLPLGTPAQLDNNGMLTIALSNEFFANGQTETFALRASIGSSCNGAKFQPTILAGNGYDTVTNTVVPIEITGTAPLIGIVHPFNIQTSGIPDTICQGVYFTPQGSSTWFNTPLCNGSLVATWNFGYGGTLQTATGFTPDSLAYDNTYGQLFIYLIVQDTTSGFTEEMSKTIVINQKPSAYVSSLNNSWQLNCLTDTVLMQAMSNGNNGPTTFEWFWNGNPVSTNALLPITNPGNYAVVPVSTNGCIGLQNSFTINRDTFALQILSGNSTIFDSVILICPNQTSYVNAYIIGTNYSPITYYWNDGSNTQYKNNVTAGEYSVTAFNGLGCSATNTVTVQTRTVVPPTLIAEGPTTFCNGGSVLLKASSGYTNYYWNNGTYNNDSSQIVSWSGSFSVQAYDTFNCVSNSDTINVTVLPTPSTPYIQQFGCELVSSNSGNSMWLLNGSQLPDSTATIFPTASGFYTVMSTTQQSCPSSPSSQLYFELPALPSISTNGPVTFCASPTNSVELTASSGNSFLWSNGSTDQAITVQQSGSFTVTVTNGNCVQAALPVVVTVDSNCNLPQPGTLNFFTASPDRICAGQYTTFNWSTSNLVSAFIRTFDTVMMVQLNGEMTMTDSIARIDTFTLYGVDHNGDTTLLPIPVTFIQCNTTGIASVDNETHFSFFPNPATTNITLENVPAHIKNVKIISVTGQVVTNEEITDNKTLDVSHLAAGVYMLRLDDGTNEKFVKQ